MRYGAHDDSYLRCHILPSFGSMQLRAVERSDVQEWVKGHLDAGYGPATIRKAFETPSNVSSIQPCDACVKVR